MKRERKYPLMPFDTGDWLRCPELRAVAPDARALWMDMLCYMWESPEKGVMVAPNGKPYSQAEIVRIVGLGNDGTAAWLDALIQSGVCGVRADGAIYSRRMVREEDLRQKRADAGRKGGQTARGRERDRKAASELPRHQDGPNAGTSQEQEEPQELVLFNTPAEEATRKPAKKKAKNEPKIQFAEFVTMTQTEYDKLVIDYGKNAVDWMINKLNNTKGSTGRHYKSDYLATLNWVVGAYYEEMNKGYGKTTYANGRTDGGAEQASGFATGSTL